MNRELDPDFDDEDDFEDWESGSHALESGGQSRWWRQAAIAIATCGIIAAASMPARAIFATEGTLRLFLYEQIAEMVRQYAVQSDGWGFHKVLVNAGIEAGLATVYDSLAQRKRYREIGFTWETPDPVYGRVDRLLGLCEGDVPQTEAEAVAMENAYIQVVDMKTGEEERKLVLERYPGAALRYARYAAVMKTSALGGNIYAELERHRKTVEILKRIANLPRMSPGRSEQIMKVIDFYESLLDTNTAELDAVRSNAQGIDILYESYKDNLREAAKYQADSIARRQSFALETSGKRVFEHSWQ
jgi:hypothetical protein